MSRLLENSEEYRIAERNANRIKEIMNGTSLTPKRVVIDGVPTDQFNYREDNYSKQILHFPVFYYDLNLSDKVPPVTFAVSAETTPKKNPEASFTFSVASKNDQASGLAYNRYLNTNPDKANEEGDAYKWEKLYGFTLSNFGYYKISSSEQIERIINRVREKYKQANPEDSSSSDDTNPQLQKSFLDRFLRR